MSTPGFLINGIDFYQLLCAYVQSNIEITDPQELALIIDLMKHVIGNSYGYKNDFASTIYGRFQMIFNSTIQEAHIFAIAKKYGMDLCKRSDSKWLLSDTHEIGTDFYYKDLQIEAKVYKNLNNMLSYAEQGSINPTVFHNADYVLCYLIDRPWPEELMAFEDMQEFTKRVGTSHWYWLRRINGQYVLHFNEDLYTNTHKALSPTLPICKCRQTSDKFSISLDTNLMF